MGKSGPHINIHPFKKVHIEKPGGDFDPLEFNYAYKLLFPAATANQSTTCFDEAEGFSVGKEGQG